MNAYFNRMQTDLFSKPPQYTIDTSSLIDIFGAEKMVSKAYTPGLWEKMLDLFAQGILISHAEVLKEIKKDGTKGEELYDWAQANAVVFRDYDWLNEGRIIRSMSPKYVSFVSGGKVSPHHADPWLVAQAKVLKLKVVTEETPKKYSIPIVCLDPMFNVGCINLVGLVKERAWKFTA